MCTESFCYAKINLFKYKRFKDGRCCYKIIVPSHLKQWSTLSNFGMGCAARTPNAN